jgi:hypothetical protein
MAVTWADGSPGCLYQPNRNNIELCEELRDMARAKRQDGEFRDDVIADLFDKAAGALSSQPPAQTFASLVAAELARAYEKHKRGIYSAHEGYAVIKEELDEAWDEIKSQHHDKAKLLAELVQVAAMCQRTAEDLKLL